MTATVRVWTGTAIFAAGYFALGADRYATYHSGADLGLFTQSIATVFHGFRNSVEGGSHFTVHFSPILYLCAPVLLAMRSPLALVGLQAVACALAAPPLYLFARRRVGESLASGVAVVALLYPPLAGVTFADFHENGFAPAATMWLLWAVDARRWRWAALFAVLTLAVKEDQAVIVGCAAIFAIVYFVRRGERAGVVFGVAALVAAAVVFVGFFAVVRPLAGARDLWGPLHFYSWSRPVADATPWWSLARPSYFVEAMIPLAFVGITQPLFLLALPGFAEDLLSHESITFTMGQHYAAVWIGYVLAAFAAGIAAIARRSAPRALTVVRTCTVVCVLVLAFASPTHWGHYLRSRDPHDRELDRTIAQLPATIAVGTHDEIFAHLGFDPNASLGLTRDPRYALVDGTFATSYWVQRMQPRLELEVDAGRYALVRSAQGIRLYERIGRAGGRRNAARDRESESPWTLERRSSISLSRTAATR